MILPGTYQNGFAPRDGEPLYPELQVGCIGDWSPGLGPTGTVLRDWSCPKSHLSFSAGMTAESGWAVNSGRYSLSFDGVDDYVTKGSRLTSGAITSLSVSVWAKFTGSGTFYIGAEGYNTNTKRSWELLSFFRRPRVRLSSNGTAYQKDYQSSVDYLSSPGFHHLAFVFSRSSLKLYIDGTEDVAVTKAADAAMSSIFDNPSGVFNIGADGNFANLYNSHLDDFRVYTRELFPNEIRLLATRRGIAHELAPVRYAGSAGFLAAWRRQQSFIIGGGLQ